MQTTPRSWSTHRRPIVASMLASLVVANVLGLVPPGSKPLPAHAAGSSTPLHATRVSGVKAVHSASARQGTSLFVAHYELTLPSSLWVRRMGDKGQTEELIRQVPDSFWGRDPSIAVNGDVVALAWSDHDFGVMAAISGDRGSTWQTFDLNDRGGLGDLAAFYPQVSVGAGVVYVAFGEAAAARGVHVMSTTDSGATWSHKRLGRSLYQGHDVDVAADGATAVVAFGEETGPSTAVWRTDDRGASWTPQFFPRSGYITSTRVEVDGTSAWVTYQVPTLPFQGKYTIEVLSSTGAGAAFAGQTVDTAAGLDLDTAAVGGSLYLAYNKGNELREAIFGGPGATPSDRRIGPSAAEIDVDASLAAVAVAYVRHVPFGSNMSNAETFVASRELPSGNYVTINVSESDGFSFGLAASALGGSWAAVWTDGYWNEALKRYVVHVYMKLGAPGDPDIIVEAASAIQAAAGAEELAAGKLTALRAKVRVTDPYVKDIPIRWEALWNDESGAPRTYSHREVLRLGQGTSTRHHEPPGGLRPGVGPVTVRVTVDPDNTYVENDEQNNVKESNHQVVQTRPYRILVRPLTTLFDPTVECPSVNRARAAVERVVAGAFPVDDREVTVDALCLPRVITSVVPGVTYSDTQWAIWLSLTSPDSFGYDNVVYVLPDGFITKWVANQNGAIGLAWDGLARTLVEQQGVTGYPTAHELSHSLGWVDPAHPANHPDPAHSRHTDALPSPGYFVAERTAYGDDLAGNPVVDWMEWKSDSTPGSLSRWISRQTWAHLLGRFRVGTPDGLGVQSAATLAGPALRVTGATDETGSLTLAPLTPAATAGVPSPGAGPGDVRLRLVDAAGAEVATAVTSLRRAADVRGGHEDDPAWGVFTATVPDRPDARALEVSVDGALVGRQQRSAHAPTVQLVTPLGGKRTVRETLHVAWTAADADGEAVRSYLSVTTNGGATWRSIGLVEGTSYDLPLTAHLRGDDVRVKVTVNDGWNSAVAESAPMQVGGGLRNGRIVTSLTVRDGSEGVYSVLPDGSGVTHWRLGKEEGGRWEPLLIYDLRVSPDGKTFAFIGSYEVTAIREPGLWMVDSDGTNLRRVIALDDPTVPISTFSSVDWSPDGSSIALLASTKTARRAGIWLANPDGTNLRKVHDLNIDYGTHGDHVRWAPDGSRIAFNDGRCASCGAYAIVTIKPDGTDRRTVIDANFISNVAWSPDGSRFAFSRLVSSYRVLWTVNADGTRPAQVPGPDPGTTVRGQEPTWSPDGELLAFRGNGLQTVPPQGGPVRTLLASFINMGHWTAATAPPDQDPSTLPPAVDAGGPYTADEFGTVALSATVTGGAPPVTVEWDVDGDGVFAEGVGSAVTVPAPGPGQSTVSVRATGADGQVGVDTATVSVNNLAPTVTNVLGVRAGAGTAVSATVTDAVAATIDWGDGRGPQPVALVQGADGSSLQVIGVGPPVSGPATLRVTDGLGAATVVAVELPAAPNAPPVAADQAVSTERGRPVIVSGLASDAGGDPLSLSVASVPAHGTVAVLDDNTVDPVVVYVPEPSWVGTDTFSVVARDAHGASAPATVTVTITPRPDDPPPVPPVSFSGFFPPVENEPALNRVTPGQAVPVKFGLGGDRGLNIFTNGYPASRSVGCTSRAPAGPLEPVNPADLRYDAASSRYQFEWKTDRGWARQCRQLVLRFIDGTEKTASFQFR